MGATKIVDSETENLKHAPEMEVPSYDPHEFHGKSSKFCVCVFVINEGERLHKQLERMREHTADVDVIIADGGSSDGSTNHGVLNALGVNTLLVKTGSGKLGAQMRMAFSWAINRGYEGIIVIDGSNKDNPEAIPSFAKALTDGTDHVQGSRFIADGVSKNLPLSRFLGLKLLHAPAIRWASGFHYTDTTNGFRAYSARFLLDKRVDLFRSVFEHYELHYYLAIRASELGYSVQEIPVERVYPATGKIPTKISPLAGNMGVLKTLFVTCMGAYHPSHSLSNRRFTWFPKMVLFLFVMSSLVMGIGGVMRDFQKDSDILVTKTIRKHYESKKGTSHNRMLASDSPTGYRYQQYGLQSRIMLPFVPSYGQGNPELVIWGFRVLHAILLGLVLVVLLSCVFRYWGGGTALLTFPFLLFALPIWQYSTNLYWVAWTFYLPFVLTLMLYPKLRARKLLPLLYGLIALVVFIKCLTGFEYISSILAATVVPITLVESREGCSSGLILRRVFAMFFAGFVGFTAAFLWNWYDLAITLNSSQKAWALILSRAVHRTYGQEFNVMRDILKYSSYLFLDSQWFFLCLLGIAVMLDVMSPATEKRDRWGLLILVALCSTLSWNTLMSGHMRSHLHINTITFYMPFNFIVLFYFGHMLMRTLHYAFPRKAIMAEHIGRWLFTKQGKLLFAKSE